MSGLPLDGIRVIDLSRNIAGPLCTMLLGDLGADVVKVERPGGGDEARNHSDDPGTSPYFASLNRNKRSICLDLKDGGDADRLARLLTHADVCVENLRPGALARLGFDDDRLARDFPELIMCHVSGFGRTGPWADAAAYDHIIQGFSGLMSLTGPPGEGGYRTNTSVADVVTGLFAATSLAASLRGRRPEQGPQGETGDVIDVSLLGSLLNALCYQSATYLSTGVAPEPTGNEHPYIVPYGTYPTNDGHVSVCVGNNALFARFCRALGIEGALDDERFADNHARVRHRDELNALVRPALALRTSDEWLAAFAAEGIPSGPIHTLPEALDHPQVAALDLVHEVDNGVGGRYAHLRAPFSSPRLGGMIRRRPPLVGEHTAEVLAEVGEPTTPTVADRARP
ncbi:CoA transferase [Egibacter rhizosphaerae]|uniref:CoA transferase n=1 Tax=Egibacter rhizosphaerae TaxID=1670831 RepID=A0A411YFL9_9ACTN|nr:CaiB/BaiF CoA-transferase family protein [Egibacter rhizosphaerae]QBI19907.1 CoA transferase [Egibacter rhizosphaerae]